MTAFLKGTFKSVAPFIEVGKSDKNHEDSDPKFEEARIKWQRMSDFFASMKDKVKSTNHSMTAGLSHPIKGMEETIRTYFQDEKIDSSLAKEFSQSVVKLDVATTKYDEMMQSYRIVEEIDGWLTKAEAIKKDIIQRDASLHAWRKQEAKYNSERTKAEHKQLMKDIATVAKLSKLEEQWKTSRSQYNRLNEKVILDVDDITHKIAAIINDEIGAIATSQFWLFWTLSEAYGHWHQQESSKYTASNPYRLRARRGVPTNPIPSTPTPAEPQASSDSTKTTSSTPADSGTASVNPSVPMTPPKKPTPLPPPKSPQVSVDGQTSTASATGPPATPTKALPTLPPKPGASANTTTTAQTPPTTVTWSDQQKKRFEVVMDELEEERTYIEKQKEKIAAEWQQLDLERRKLANHAQQEMARIDAERANLQEEIGVKNGQISEAQRVLDRERDSLEEAKKNLEKRVESEDDRVRRNREVEAEYKSMEEERKNLEEKKRQIAEGIMRKKLEEEWKKLEDKKKELEELRKVEEENKRKEEARRLEEEHKRLARLEEERRKQEAEERLIAEREKERAGRTKMRLEEERKQLELTKKMLEEEETKFHLSPSTPSSLSSSSTPTLPITSSLSIATSNAELSNSRPSSVQLSSSSINSANSIQSEPAQPQGTLVVALYPYNAQEEGELSFVQGEELTILDYDDDASGWWNAVNKSGQKGTVPANFVKKVDQPKTPTPVTASADKVKETLKTKIEEAPKVEEPLKSVEETSKVEEPPKTSHPSHRMSSRLSIPSQKPLNIETKTEADEDDPPIGKVVALYDYKASEEGELNFKKGDVLLLLEKDDEGGWWIGELNGEMGLFPRNYVKEMTAAAASTSSTLADPKAVVAEPLANKTDEQKASEHKLAKALYDYTAQEQGELTLKMEMI